LTDRLLPQQGQDKDSPPGENLPLWQGVVRASSRQTWALCNTRIDETWRA